MDDYIKVDSTGLTMDVHSGGSKVVSTLVSINPNGNNNANIMQWNNGQRQVRLTGSSTDVQVIGKDGNSISINTWNAPGAKMDLKYVAGPTNMNQQGYPSGRWNSSATNVQNAEIAWPTGTNVFTVKSKYGSSEIISDQAGPSHGTNVVTADFADVTSATCANDYDNTGKWLGKRPVSARLTIKDGTIQSTIDGASAGLDIKQTLKNAYDAITDMEQIVDEKIRIDKGAQDKLTKWEPIEQQLEATYSAAKTALAAAEADASAAKSALDARSNPHTATKATALAEWNVQRNQHKPYWDAAVVTRTGTKNSAEGALTAATSEYNTATTTTTAKLTAKNSAIANESLAQTRFNQALADVNNANPATHAQTQAAEDARIALQNATATRVNAVSAYDAAVLAESQAKAARDNAQEAFNAAVTSLAQAQATKAEVDAAVARKENEYNTVLAQSQAYDTETTNVYQAAYSEKDGIRVQKENAKSNALTALANQFRLDELVQAANPVITTFAIVVNESHGATFVKSMNSNIEDDLVDDNIDSDWGGRIQNKYKMNDYRGGLRDTRDTRMRRQQ